MSKKKWLPESNEISIINAMLRIKTLESILINKGVITIEEYQKEMETMARETTKIILQKANVEGNLDEIIDGFKNKEI
jgi:exosome complex RNA-binding protein Rrp4